MPPPTAGSASEARDPTPASRGRAAAPKRPVDYVFANPGQAILRAGLSDETRAVDTRAEV